MIQEYMDEKLWETAQILLEEERPDHALLVIHSIASHAIGRYSGKHVEVCIDDIPKKEVKTEQLKLMAQLSKDVSNLASHGQYTEAQEKAMEYLDGIVSLLSSSSREEYRLRRNLFKHLVHIDNGNINNTVLFNTTTISPQPGEFTPGTSVDTSVAAAVETYTTSEVASILHVSDQTVRRMCEAGKFPKAERTSGGHWRIPREYFKVILEQSKQIDKELIDIRNKSEGGGEVDEFSF
jgi:excisionase family DNA binding protein